MATKVRDRAFAFFGAILFLVTSSIAGIALIIVLIVQHNDGASDDSTTTSQSSSTNTNTEGELEGTKLKNFTPVSSVPSLEKIDTVVGTGAEAEAGDTVTVDYTGAVAATGVIFQSSLDTGQTATFSLDGVIEGWTEGIPGMKVGGTRRLIIPADLAYGANPPSGSGIPANAPLVFDVTLHAVSK